MFHRKLIRNGFRALGAILVTASGLVHAQVSISQLPPANLPLKPTDQIIVNQTISGVKATRQSPISTITGGLNSHFVLQAADPTLLQSRVLTGTANQVIITDGGALGNLTLSLPQSIAPSNSPTFAGLTLTGPLSGTTAGFSGNVSVAGLTATSGNFSGGAVSMGALTATTGNFSGAVSALSLSLTNPLPATSGGTGQSSYAVGDILSADTTTTLSKIPDVSVGSYLRSGGINTLPLWSTLKLPNSALQGDLFFASAANTMGNLADVAAGSYLRSGGVGANPVYSTTTIPNTSVLGDLWYGSASNVVSTLAGNITTTKQFLTQTGSGAVSAAPVWGTIAAGDLPGSFSGFANPTASVGLAAVNGSATTAMRSDAAPALSQAISPTMTGTWVFSPTAAGTNFTINNTTSAASSTLRVASTFTSISTNPLLTLISTASTPLATFSISANGTVGTDDFTIFQNGASNRDASLLNRSSTGVLNLGTSGSNRVVIAAAGGVTINAPSSGTAFTSNAVSGGATEAGSFACNSGSFSATANPCLTLRNSSASAQTPIDFFSSTSTLKGRIRNDSNGSMNYVGFNSSGSNHVFWVNGDSGVGSSAMTINNVGAVSISAPTSSGNALSATGRAGNLAGSFQSSTTSGQAFGLAVNGGTTSADYAFLASDSTGASTYLRVRGDGAIAMPNILNTSAAQTGTMCWNSTQISYDTTVGCLTSSIRFKRDIQPLDEGLDAVMRMRPVSYDLKPEYDSFHLGPQVGLIAEEIEKIDRRLVGYEPDGRTVRGVRYVQLTAVLAKAIQDQQREIRQLQVAVALLFLGLIGTAWKVFHRKG